MEPSVHSELRGAGTSAGSVSVGGTTAFVAQKAFIMNDSVTNNIVFYGRHDEERYDRVLGACCLKQVHSTSRASGVHKAIWDALRSVCDTLKSFLTFGCVF